MSYSYDLPVGGAAPAGDGISPTIGPDLNVTIRRLRLREEQCVRALNTTAETLRLRTEALARVVEQLDAVRALHPPTGTEWPPGIKCTRCSEFYPCATAKAAGVPS